MIKHLNINKRTADEAFVNITNTFDLIESKLCDNYEKFYLNSNNGARAACTFEDMMCDDSYSDECELFLLSNNKFSYIDVTFASLAYPFALDFSQLSRVFAKGRKEIVAELIDVRQFKQYCPDVYDSMMKLNKRPVWGFWTG